MVNGWKVTAIIFILLFVVETLFLCYAFNLGTSVENNRVKCSNDICFNLKASSFTFDEYSNTCICRDENNKIIYQEVMP